MTEKTSPSDPRGGAPTEARAVPAKPAVLRGTPVAPGLAMGRVFRKEYDLAGVPIGRIPLDQVETALNQFHAALRESHQQLETLKEQLRGIVPKEHVRILDTHVAYLKDSVFLSDVENLILNEQMSLEGAIAKVILDFDRIFRLVESEALRERAVDLRDVGIRVLRNLELATAEPEAAPPETKALDHVLVARELSVVDMFTLDDSRVLAILTEGGSLTSHAAMLARSMRIPTLTAVEGLLAEVAEGDFVIVDAAEGVVRVRPDEIVRDQYKEARDDELALDQDTDRVTEPACTADGEALYISASCGNLPDVERAGVLQMTGVGLYRTELLFLIERSTPSLDALIAHYRSVLEPLGEGSVTFRLLDVDSSAEMASIHPEREPNPSLGLCGVRALLARPSILRRQLQAILRAAGETPGASSIRIAIPKVVDCGELRKIKEILFEERYALKKSGQVYRDSVAVGVVIETPAALIGIDDLLAESDFVLVGLDSLQQYLLASDRSNAELAPSFEQLHPFVLRALRSIQKAAKEADKHCSIFGVTATQRENLSLLLGSGFRHFSVAPTNLHLFLRNARSIDLKEAVKATDVARERSSAGEFRRPPV